MSKPLNILQVCRETPAWGFDLFKYISQAFDPEHTNVTTVFLDGEPNPALAQHYNGTVYFLYSPRNNVCTRLIRFIKLLKICIKHRISDTICHHYKPTTLMSKISWFYPLKGKFSVHHNIGNFKKSNRKRYCRLWLKQWQFIAVSNSVKKDLLTANCGITEQNCQTIYNAIDIAYLQSQQYSTAAAKQILNLPENSFVLGNVGRFIAWKDQALLIKAFAQIKSKLGPDAKLVIIGVGPLEQALKEQAAASGVARDTLILTGIPDAYRMMTAFDVFILPSINEPFGLVLLEAMAASLPLIINDSGGAPEVAGSIAKVVPVSDERALANAMLALYQLPAEERKSMGIKGLQHLQATYSIEGYQAAFRTAISSGNCQAE